MLEPLNHRPVVLDPQWMIHSPKLNLLPGSPKMRDQELAGEKVPGSEQKGSDQRGESHGDETRQHREEEPSMYYKWTLVLSTAVISGCFAENDSTGANKNEKVTTYIKTKTR